MKSAIVRIESIEIINFKNVNYGYIDLRNTRTDFQSSVLGLYGQNGSGKTALIDSLLLLKLVLSGRPVSAEFANYINVDSDSATLRYTFKVEDKRDVSSYLVHYEISIRKDLVDPDDNDNQKNGRSQNYRVTIFNELLSYSYEGNDRKVKMSPIVDTRASDIFVPKTKYEALVGTSKETMTNLLVSKKLTTTTSRSFVFSRELLNTIRKNCLEGYHLSLFERLVFFGNYRLFVISTANTGLISMNTLPLAFNYDDGSYTSTGSLLIDLNGPSLIPASAVEVVGKVIKNMNVVLTQLVPGLTIGLKSLGMQLDSDSNVLQQIQLTSNKNSKEIPLRYESDGIKKIISILQLLIVVYNQRSITVAIDELDSGVFEYLLGELLRIISEKGKGQLLFTSHNLRTLETLNKGFIAFTTTNPCNRYIRMNNVKTSNNLRDFYYRDIVLGEQCEPVYDATNNFEIALAFREAGEHNAS